MRCSVLLYCRNMVDSGVGRAHGRGMSHGEIEDAVADWAQARAAEGCVPWTRAVTHPPLRLVSGCRRDPLARQQRFEVAHPEVAIVPPGTLNDSWRAIVRPGKIPGLPFATTIRAWQLEDLMDQLDRIYPPGEGTGGL